MKPTVVLIIILSLPLSVGASHGWSEIDLCSVYRDRLPPGLSAELLPDAASQGASLLVRYCTQCHNLPGPDRHSAAEWRELAPKMFVLMDVASRFSGARGKVEAMRPAERAILLTYLQHHAVGSAVNEKTIDGETVGDRWLNLSLTLLPLLLLTMLGLLRWRQILRRDYKSCALDQF